MNLKIRRTIFYILIFVFFVLTIFIIPYSNGWRFDFNTLSFVKLGGIYLETQPTDTQIKIDKLVFQAKAGLIKSGLLVANLFPKTYKVSIQKDGYQTWNKNIIVKPSLVTQIHQIILLPEKWNEETIAKNIQDFFSNNNGYVVVKDTVGKLKVDGKTIKGTQFLSWLYGEKSALVYDDVNKNFLVINLSQNNTASNINIIFENLRYQKSILDTDPIKKALPMFGDKNKLVLATNKSIYLLDFYKPSLEIMINGQYNLLNTDSDEIFFSDENKLYSYNINSKQKSILSQTSRIDSLEISPNNQLIAFSNKTTLNLLERTKDTENIKIIIENPSYFKFSPDSKKLLAQNNNQIKILFLGNDYDLFQKKQMSSSTFALSNLNNDFKIVWHPNSAYIFIKKEDRLELLEIDDATLALQSVNIDADKYFFDQTSETIYIINKNTLYKLLQ